MSRPTFSVIIPTWNDAAHLPRAIDSVLSQTLRDFELVVVDDGSTDATRKLLGRYRDSRLHTVHQGRSGVSAARNRGLQEARGHWVIFLDSDDQALPEWLEALYPGTQQSKAGLIGCGLWLVYPEASKKTEDFAAPATETLLPGNGEPLFRDLSTLFLAGAFAVEAGLMRNVGGFETDLAYSENTDLGIRLADRCLAEGRAAISIPRPLIRYHLQPESLGQQSRTVCRRRLESIRYFLRYHKEAFARQPESLRSFLALGGVLAARLGYSQESRVLFRQGLQLAPWQWRAWVRYGLTLVPPLARRVWREPVSP